MKLHRLMPDNSVMLKLCEIFEISVNKLLSGERLSSVDYNKKAEVTLMSETSAFL